MVAVVDARDYYKSGETIELAYNMNKAHFFDAETENVIRNKATSKVEVATI